MLLVLLVERSVGRHTLELTRPEYWDWRLAGKAARSKARECKVFCFGTSRLQQSLVPHIIEEKTGWRAWNFGVCWGQAPGYYFLLKRAIEAGAKPEAVIVEYHPTAITGTYRDTDRYWPDMMTNREALELALVARDADFFATIALARAFPSIKDRFQIQSTVMAALRGQKDDGGLNTRLMIRNKNVNRGAFLLPTNVPFRAELTKAYTTTLLAPGWACNATNIVFIDKLLALAASHKIPVYWTLPPFTADVQSLRESQGAAAKYAAFVKGWQARYPNLFVLDAEQSHYTQDAFSDACHLNKRGACTMTADIGQALRHASNPDRADRWIVLPKYRESPSSAPIEDIPMSQAILLRRGAALR